MAQPCGKLGQDDVVRLLTRHYTMLQAYAAAIVRNPSLADEVVQEASVVVIQKAAQSTTAELFPRWIRGIARNVALKLSRDSGRHARVVAPQILDQMEGTWSRYDDSRSVRPRLDALRQCVSTLSETARELLRLRYEEKCSGEAMSQRLQRPVDSIYVSLGRVHRAVENCMRARLAREALAREAQ